MGGRKPEKKKKPQNLKVPWKWKSTKRKIEEKRKGLISGWAGETFMTEGKGTAVWWKLRMQPHGWSTVLFTYVCSVINHQPCKLGLTYSLLFPDRQSFFIIYSLIAFLFLFNTTNKNPLLQQLNFSRRLCLCHTPMLPGHHVAHPSRLLWASQSWHAFFPPSEVLRPQIVIGLDSLFFSLKCIAHSTRCHSILFLFLHRQEL